MYGYMLTHIGCFLQMHPDAQAPHRHNVVLARRIPGPGFRSHVWVERTLLRPCEAPHLPGCMDASKEPCNAGIHGLLRMRHATSSSTSRIKLPCSADCAVCAV